MRKKTLSPSLPRPGCCSLSCRSCAGEIVSRRNFLVSAAAPGMVPFHAASKPAATQPTRKFLRVQPVLVYTERTRKAESSWRWTAEIYDPRLVAEERERIIRELAGMEAQAGFPLRILPLISVKDKSEAAAVPAQNYDVLIMYATARNADVLEVLARPDKWNLVFVRHKSGPIYYMYVGIHGHFFRKRTDHFVHSGMDIHDVVVDSLADLLWRLRALAGLENAVGKRIVTIGSPGGWGAMGGSAPDRAREKWGFDIRSVTYDELRSRIQRARNDQALLKRCRQAASDYLGRGNVRLETPRHFLDDAFLLAEIFREYLSAYETDALTIGSCMSTVMGVAGTTACVALSVLNDEGRLALCEADFESIPAGVLLHYISGKPVFMANASFPYDGEVMVSHCTAPAKMDGSNPEAVRILTHYESDFGAAPKVEMRAGQRLTVLDPDFEGKRLLGFGGEIRSAPFFPMCRTQLEVGVNGDTSRLAEEIRGWHWMVCYGDYLKETGYAARKLGLEWFNLK